MSPQSKRNTDRKKIRSYAVTGTFHGSLIDADTEGEARRIFHDHYHGESIIHIQPRYVPAGVN